MTETTDPLLFEAQVVPHRSLSRRGLWIIIGFMGSVSACVTTLFWMMGAWPIAGFSGGEVLLAIFLLRAHGRGQRRREVLRLSGQGFRIHRYDAQGRHSEQVLQPAWLRVILEERPGRAPGLFLSTRGRLFEVAAFLGEPEKRDLFDALAGALHRFRNPVFDNPQLCGD